jgi:hypothetical protein
MTEPAIPYLTATPTPKFYTESLTLAEHQLIMRIRQLCKRDGTVILLIEIIDREQVKAGVAMQRLE